jgi:hypothetical protein
VIVPIRRVGHARGRRPQGLVSLRRLLR